MRLAATSLLVVFLVLSAFVTGFAADGAQALAAARGALDRAVALGSDEVIPKALLRGATVVDVKAVHHPATLEPIYDLASVATTDGRVVGLIGVDPNTGEALWYRFGLNLDRFPSVSLAEAHSRVRDHLRAHLIGDDVGTGKLVSGQDRRLYWRFDSADGRAWLVDSEELASAVVSADEMAAAEPACCGPQRKADVRAHEHRILDSGGLPVPLSVAQPAAYNISGLPYHYQITSWYCCLASMQMIFDYYGQEIGQHDIGDVADEDPSYGVYHDGIVRSVLFSGMSTAVQNPSLQGYVERQLGYACSDFWFGGLSAPSRYTVLKDLIYAGYPILVSTWFDQSEGSGHCRVVKGYDDNLSVFIIHDPWYYGAMSGPNLMINQSVFMELWIDWSYGESILIKPWILRPDFPSTVAQGDTFSVDLKVKYPGPYPYDNNGWFPAYDNWARITLPVGLTLASGSPTITLPGLNTGDSTVVSWDVVATGLPGEYGMAFHAQGTVDDPYQAYTDTIGGHAYETVEVASGLLAGWDDEERLTANFAGSHTCFPSARAMVLEDDGTAHIVWEDTRDGNSEIYYRCRTDGEWGAESRLTIDANLSWSPCIDQGPDGRLHVAWVDARDGNHEVYYKTWDPVGGWSSDERVTVYSEVDCNPCIAAGDTAVYLAWEARQGGLYRVSCVLVKQRTATGWGAIGGITDLDAAPARDSYRPSVVYGADRILHVVYERNTNNDPNEKERVVHRSWNGATWTARVGLSSEVSYSRTAVVAAGPDSTVHVVWQDGENIGGDIFYIKQDGGAWQAIEEIATGGTEAGTPSVAVDGTGKVHAVWVDNRHGEAEIYYRSNDGLGWSEETRLTRAAEASILPTVAANHTGEVCVVWTDLRHGDAELYFRSAGASSGAPWIAGPVMPKGLVYISNPHPAPFRDEVRFTVDLARASGMSLEVFDILGRRVRTLARGAYAAGSHSSSWNGEADSGEKVAPGVYFIRCETPEGRSARRAVIVR